MTNDVVKYDKKWADDAKRVADKERVESNTISHRSGKFKCGDMEFPELCAIIVGDLYENSYYEGSFDPDELSAPTCYAFAEDEDDLSPHPSMQNSPDFFVPQNHD